eukprot:GHVU01098565.1.p3 GENE.GHVU01098565.1~~GHVU01098565.1.p3  ORF type:complete len:120 (-),score=5.54 GHVU01098565.1:223-582(-)
MHTPAGQANHPVLPGAAPLPPVVQHDVIDAGVVRFMFIDSFIEPARRFAIHQKAGIPPSRRGPWKVPVPSFAFLLNILRCRGSTAGRAWGTVCMHTDIGTAMYIYTPNTPWPEADRIYI